MLLIFCGDNLPGLDGIGPLEEFELILLESGLAMERSLLAKREKQVQGRRGP